MKQAVEVVGGRALLFVPMFEHELARHHRREV
jgi:hypothetical protein